MALFVTKLALCQYGTTEEVLWSASGLIEERFYCW